MKTSVIACLVAGASLTCEAQGTFQNLDFEGANVVLVGGQVPTIDALPGWHAYSNTTELVYISYNLFTAIPTVGLYGSNSYVVDGNFSVWLSGNGSVAQAGTVPTNAQSLLFKTFGPPLAVTLGGQALSCVPLSSGPGYDMYGADVSAFAGQSTTLTFAFPPFFTPLDDIQFSPEPVPEPSTLSVLVAVTLIFAVHRRSKDKGAVYPYGLAPPRKYCRCGHDSSEIVTIRDSTPVNRTHSVRNPAGVVSQHLREFMKISVQILVYSSFFINASSSTTLGQGTFQNLDFESAKIIPYIGYNIAVSNALPGWTAASGTNGLALIPYNVFTFVPVVGLYGSNSYPVSGNFSAWVGGGGSISQTGLIPVSTRSLLFKQGTLWGPTPTPELSLNGTPLTLIAVSSGPNYVLYGADATAFAGQTDTLTISGGGLLDDIIFSPDPVPEPDAPILFFIGMLLFAIRWWRYLAGRQR